MPLRKANINKNIIIINLLLYLVICLMPLDIKADDDKISNPEITDNSVKDQDNKIDAIKDALSRINRSKKVNKSYNFESLMFSSKELDDIDKIMNSKDDPKKTKVDKKSKEEKNIREIATFGKIYLSSILYLSNEKWLIWINGEKISSLDNSELNQIYITSVTADRVDLIWSMSPSKWRIILELPANAETPKLNELGQIEIKVSLKSHETYILKHDKIIKGKI